jgi:hypothetical protein
MTIRFLLRSVFLFLTVAAQVASGGNFADENGNEQVIETTDSHPFWVVSESGSRYVDAKDLQVGNIFIGANGELTTLTVTNRVGYPDGITVYNFTVADNHNYFVVASLEAYENGASVVLVHNADYHSSIKGNPFSGADAPANAFKHLETYHGIPAHIASNRLHIIKKASGLKATDNVVIGKTGDVYDAITGNLSVQSLTLQ